LACAYGNVPIDDVRVDRDEFVRMKEEGKLPFGQLPVLYVDDSIPLYQSAAIAKYIGRFAGLYPADDAVTCAKIDGILDSEIDLFMGLSVARYKGMSMLLSTT
jgi:prostaglandin-H2 D-isomerase / glutathione transferase